MWQNSATQNATKLKNSRCDKTQKLKCDKTQNVTKLKNSNCDTPALAHSPVPALDHYPAPVPAPARSDRDCTLGT